MESSNLQPPTSNLQLAPVFIAIAVFSALSITCAVTSEGFLEADGCTHYMYARWAFEYPTYFIDIWGRPFKTALYAPAAATVGLIGVRLTSLCVAIVIALTAAAIARGQGFRWPALAVIFTFAQPLLFLHSFSELTELPFAMLLGLAFLAYQRRRWWAVAVLSGLLPLSRPEGFAFVLLVAAGLAFHRQWRWLPVLAVPVIAWQIAGAIMYREPQNWWCWLPMHWPYAGDSLYPRGPMWHFVALLPALTGPVVFPFVLVGAWRSVAGCHPDSAEDRHPECTREGPTSLSDETSQTEPANESTPTTRSLSRQGSIGMTPSAMIQLFRDSHAFRCDVLIAAIPVTVLIGHSLLYATGKMASNGELRYLLIAAPFWALLAARGWEWAWGRLPIADCQLPIGGPILAEMSREAAVDSSLGRKPQEIATSISSPEGAKEDYDAESPFASVAPSGLLHARKQPGAYAPGDFLPPLRGWRSPYRWAALAALAPIVANFGYKVLPLVQTEDWKTAKRIAEWYRSSGVAEEYPRIMAAHPGIFLFADISPLDPRVREWRVENVVNFPADTVLVWDNVYGVFNADAAKSVTLQVLHDCGLYMVSSEHWAYRDHNETKWLVEWRSRQPWSVWEGIAPRRDRYGYFTLKGEFRSR